MKTGTTLLAQQVLITLVETDGKRLLLVVAGSQDRYADTTQLLNWIEDYVEWDDG